MHPYAQLFIYFDMKTLLFFSEWKQHGIITQRFLKNAFKII